MLNSLSSFHQHFDSSVLDIESNTLKETVILRLVQCWAKQFRHQLRTRANHQEFTFISSTLRTFNIIDSCRTFPVDWLKNKFTVKMPIDQKGKDTIKRIMSGRFPNGATLAQIRGTYNEEKTHAAMHRLCWPPPKTFTFFRRSMQVRLNICVSIIANWFLNGNGGYTWSLSSKWPLVHSIENQKEN